MRPFATLRYEKRGGAGLDWIGLVDHNNDISRGEIGKYEPTYPGKLVIPGTEVTTYHGHYNSIGSTGFADFRGGPVLSHGHFVPQPPKEPRQRPAWGLFVIHNEQTRSHRLRSRGVCLMPSAGA